MNEGVLFFGAMGALFALALLYEVISVGLYAFTSEESSGTGIRKLLYSAGQFEQQRSGSRPAGGSLIAAIGIAMITSALACALIALTIADSYGFVRLGSFSLVPAMLGVLMLLVLLVHVKAHFKRWGTAERTVLTNKEYVSIIDEHRNKESEQSPQK